MEQRYRAVLEVLNDGVTVVEVARRNGVGRQTVDEWLRKYAARGLAGLVDHRSTPLSCPHQMSAVVEARIVELRREHPGWGPRTIGHRLAREGFDVVPGRSSIFRCLVRHGLVTVQARRRKRGDYKRWERAMELWQMDIVGGVRRADGSEAKIVSGIDDNSRFCASAHVVVRATDRVDFGPWRPTPRDGGRRTRWTIGLQAIPEGRRVFIAGDMMTPNHLVEAIGAAADRWNRLKVVPLAMPRPVPLMRRAGRRFYFVSTQAGLMFAEVWGTGTVDVLSCRLSDHQQLCTPEGPLACDVAVVQVSPPGPSGLVSLGMSVGVLTVALTAPLVIAQVNLAVPYVFGAGEIAVEDFDFVVENDEPFPDRGSVR